MSGKEIQAGKAAIKVSLNDKDIKSKLDKLSKRMKGFGVTAGKVGAALAAGSAAILGPITAATMQFVKAGDALDKMSIRTGVSVEALSSLGYAAGQSGTSVEALEKGFIGLSNTLADANAGSAAATDALAKLGLTAKQLEGLSPDEQMKILADALNGVADSSLRGAIAQDIFGKSGRELLPLLTAGSEGMSEMQKRAEELGIVMSSESAEAAAKLGDTFDNVRTAMAGMASKIGEALAGPLTKLLDWLFDGLIWFIRWIEENSKLVVALTAVGIAMTIASGIALTFSAVMVVLSTAISAATTLTAAFGGMVALVFTPLFIKITLAAVAVGVLTAAMIALTYAFLNFTKIGQDMWKGILSDFDKGFRGISDAFASGDLSLVASIFFQTLKTVVIRGAHGVVDAVAQFGSMVGKKITSVNNLLLAPLKWLAKAAGSDVAEQFVDKLAGASEALADGIGGMASASMKGYLIDAENDLNKLLKKAAEAKEAAEQARKEAAQARKDKADADKQAELDAIAANKQAEAKEKEAEVQKEITAEYDKQLAAIDERIALEKMADDKRIEAEAKIARTKQIAELKEKKWSDKQIATYMIKYDMEKKILKLKEDAIKKEERQAEINDLKAGFRAEDQDIKDKIFRARNGDEAADKRERERFKREEVRQLRKDGFHPDDIAARIALRKAEDEAMEAEKKNKLRKDEKIKAPEVVSRQVEGSFSARAAVRFGMGGNNAASMTAKNTRRTADEIAGMRREANNRRGPDFAR